MSEPDEEGGFVGRIGRKELYDGRIVRLSLDSVRFPDGTTGELEFIRHPGASAVIPFLDPPDALDPRLVLLRQYRYAAGGVIYEIPAGIPSDTAEAWEACASRELLEETGFEAGDLRYLSRIFTTPGFTDETIHLFAATDLTEAGARPDTDEFLEIEILRFSEVMKKIQNGEIVDAKTLCALLFAAAFLGSVWPERRNTPAR